MIYEEILDCLSDAPISAGKIADVVGLSVERLLPSLTYLERTGKIQVIKKARKLLYYV
jgi:predicted ArsR family transcriptional regulator